MVRLLLTSPDIPMNSLAAGLDRSHFNQISTLFSQTWVDFLHDPSFQALHTLQCKKQQQQQQKKKPYFLVHYSNLFLENSQGQHYCPHLMGKETEACDTEEMSPFFSFYDSLGQESG